jgi:hypothetical protein
MAKAKYSELYKNMVDSNKVLWFEFMKIHDEYQKDKNKADQFHKVGRDVLDIIRAYERRLCGPMERGVNSTYSKNVAEKFWDEVKKDLPLIGEVGVIRKKTSYKF